MERKRAGSWRDGKSFRQWLPYIGIGPDNEPRATHATPCRRRRFRRCKWHLRNAVKAVKGGLLPAGLTFDLCHLSFLLPLPHASDWSAMSPFNPRRTTRVVAPTRCTLAALWNLCLFPSLLSEFSLISVFSSRSFSRQRASFLREFRSRSSRRARCPKIYDTFGNVPPSVFFEKENREKVSRNVAH